MSELDMVGDISIILSGVNSRTEYNFLQVEKVDVRSEPYYDSDYFQNDKYEWVTVKFRRKKA